MNKQRKAGLTGTGIFGAVTILLLKITTAYDIIFTETEIVAITTVVALIGGYLGSLRGEKAANKNVIGDK